MSERRTETGELPDGIADREHGYTHNPNPQDEVAAQRARFEEMQRKLQQDRQEAAQVIEDVQQRVGEEFEQSMHDPEHEKFVQEQVEHELVDRPYLRGGKEESGDPVVTRAMPGNIESGRRVPLPTTPLDAEEFNNEE